MNKTLTQEQRISIVRYRIESAENTLILIDKGSSCIRKEQSINVYCS